MNNDNPITYTTRRGVSIDDIYEYLHDSNQLPTQHDPKHYTAPACLAWYRSNTHPTTYRLTLSIYPTNQPTVHINHTVSYPADTINIPEALHDIIHLVADHLNATGYGYYAQVTDPALREELYPVHRAGVEAKYIYTDTLGQIDITNPIRY